MQNPLVLVREQYLTPEQRDTAAKAITGEKLREKQEQERLDKIQEGWNEHPITHKILFDLETEYNKELIALFELSSSSMATDQQIRFKVVNVARIADTINRLKNNNAV